MEIKRVGVVGCGIMGSGIAQVAAQSGYQVVVSELNDQLLTKGLGNINSALSRSVEKGKMSPEEKEAVLGRLKGTTRLEDFGDCDFVVEAVVENMEEKKKVFAALDKVCPKHAILASNTSCLSIIEMAMATQRPDQVLGAHFFNPVPVMRLLELVRSIATSDQTLEAAKKFGESLGKTVIVAKDAPGFIVNHLLLPFMLDAVRLVERGFATKEDIDNGVMLGLNHPMGPLTLGDLIGWDTICFIADAIYEELKDPRYAPPMLLKHMVLAGKLGRKTGQGFYDYPK
ncbi:MAG TPA: 3-hydroxybutyryl-CoA dehydrogenase [Dehalococcoidia bacterium]|nr:3-hydroxybutyryl-CoA dehydrogenase [Dehalococcoidia bacterium]